MLVESNRRRGATWMLFLLCLALSAAIALVSACGADDEPLEGFRCDLLKPENQRCIAGYRCECETAEDTSCFCVLEQSQTSSQP